MTDLPEGWANARLDDIAEVRLGRQRSPSRATGPNMRPYMRAANVTWEGLDISDVKEMDFTPGEFETYRLERGDLLLGEASGSQYEVGKPVVWNNEVPDCCFQNTLIRVRAPQSLVPYLHAHFIADARLGHFARAARGVGIHHLGQAALAAWSVKVPPANEQRRIVAKIEALTARSRTAREALEQVPPLLERFRQSVLAAAFRGDLTGGRWAPPVTIDDPSTEAPHGWEWVRLTAVARLESGHTPRKSVPEYWEGGTVPWISLRDIRAADGRTITETESMPTPLGIENSSARLLPAGTVCFSRDISVGFVTIMGREMATTQHFANWLCGDRLLNRYLMYAFIAARESLIRSGEGTTVKTIYYPALQRMSLLLPPLNEQQSIVNRLDRAFTLIEGLGTAVAEAHSRLDRLDQSVLAKAFRGELVPQDPNDEPASILLDRIRAERETAGASGGRRGRRARTSEAEPADAEDEPDDAPAAARANGTNGNGSTLHAVLGALKRDALHRIADAEGVELADRRSLDAAREGVIESGVTLEAALEHLDRDELKAVCRALGLEDRGRTKEELRARVLEAGA